MTTDIHNAACIPPSAKRPTNNTTTNLQQQQQTAPPQQLGTVPFSPMDQMEELDVAAAYCYPLTVSKHFFINCCVFSRKKKSFKNQTFIIFQGTVPTATSGTPASAVAAVAAASDGVTTATAVTASAPTPQEVVEVDSLEKALGIEFHDPNGVVQRQLLAK